MFNFKKFNFYFFLSILSGFLFGLIILFLFTNIFKPKYVMVVLEGGNIYFGEVGLFFNNKLKNPVFITQGQDGNLSLQRFSEAVWRPKNFVYLNPSKIVFWSYLQEDSPVVNFIKNTRNLPLVPSQGVQSQSNQQINQQNLSTSTNQRSNQ